MYIVRSTKRLKMFRSFANKLSYPYFKKTLVTTIRSPMKNCMKLFLAKPSALTLTCRLQIYPSTNVRVYQLIIHKLPF